MKVIITEKATGKLTQLKAKHIQKTYYDKNHNECVRVELSDSDIRNYRKDKYDFRFGG